jgi:hypothetical protein
LQTLPNDVPSATAPAPIICITMRREIVLIARDLGAPHWPALTARLILSQHTMLIRRERCRANSASKLPRLPLAQPKDLHPKEKMPIATPVTRLSV